MGRRHTFRCRMESPASDQADGKLFHYLRLQPFWARRNCPPARHHLSSRYTSVIPADHDAMAYGRPRPDPLSPPRPSRMLGFPMSTQQILRVSTDAGSSWLRSVIFRQRSSGKANVCVDVVGQIRPRVFRRPHSHWDRYRCSSRRYPSPSPAWYCRSSPITWRPGQGTGRPSRLDPPPRIPATGSAEASGHARRTRAPGSPIRQPVRPQRRRTVHQGGFQPAYSEPQQIAQLREMLRLYESPPRGHEYRPTPSQHTAGPGPGCRSLFPRHGAPHRYAWTGARYS